MRDNGHMAHAPRTVLVVEDERAIREAVAYALGAEGFAVLEAGTGEDGLRLVREESPDLVILDLMLPGLGGVAVCRALRERSTVPVIMLTARDAELDRIVGLEAGADDYVTKPFSMAELVSRVRALLRRVELDREGLAARRRVAGIEIDLLAHRVTVDGAAVHLTPTEYRLLELLSANVGRVLTRVQVMEHLWESAYVGDERACDVHIAALRRKIEADPASPRRIVTVRGVGYRLAELDEAPG